MNQIRQATLTRKATVAIPPAQLWIGDKDTTIAKTQAFLQQIFCPHQGCNTCASCMQIRTEQHYAIQWFCPEKNYTLEMIEPLFNTIQLKLASEEKHFFILKHADYLSASCANALLKSMEEPQEGYHFILLAQRLENILSTIRSRCALTTYESQGVTSAHAALFGHLMGSIANNPVAFLKELDRSKITEREIFELVDSLLNHWNKQAQAAIRASNNPLQVKALRTTSLLEKMLAYPPMPGSGKIYLKNVYLQVAHL